MSLPEYLKRLAAYSAIFFAVFAIAPATHARPIVSALFTGASPEVEETGIATLNETLEGEFRGNYLGHVFNPLQVLEARNFVQDSTTGATENPAVVSIGFSIGAESVKGLADLLYPANLTLAILIDAVLPSGDTLPANVERGINYFQVGGLGDFLRTGEIGDFISGDDNVGPSGRVANFNVETVLGDRSITHTSIDDNEGLHGLIVSELSSFSYDYLSYNREQTWQVLEPSTLALFAIGALGLFGPSWRRGRPA